MNAPNSGLPDALSVAGNPGFLDALSVAGNPGFLDALSVAGNPGFLDALSVAGKRRSYRVLDPLRQTREIYRLPDRVPPSDPVSPPGRTRSTCGGPTGMGGGHSKFGRGSLTKGVSGGRLETLTT